jgi:hypothetical protein
MIAGRDMTRCFKPYHRGSKLVDKEPLPSKAHQRCAEMDAAFQAQLSAALRSGTEKLTSRLAQNVEKPALGRKSARTDRISPSSL